MSFNSDDDAHLNIHVVGVSALLRPVIDCLFNFLPVVCIYSRSPPPLAHTRSQVWKCQFTANRQLFREKQRTTATTTTHIYIAYNAGVAQKHTFNVYAIQQQQQMSKCHETYLFTGNLDISYKMQLKHFKTNPLDRIMSPTRLLHALYTQQHTACTVHGTCAIVGVACICLFSAVLYIVHNIKHANRLAVPSLVFSLL